ncbi:MAG: hypothetical protein IJV15_06465 [Lachnospiraceae bacterium]|nr:hypothetical protein [Lachnospiraceae bacterium]
MKIAESNVTMSSNRQYYQNGFKGQGDPNSFQAKATESFVSDSSSRTYGNTGKNKDNSISSISPLSDNNSLISSPSRFQNNLLNKLLSRLYGGSMYGGNIFGSGMYGGTMSPFTQRVVSYEEHETTNFSAYGQAITEDGRTIDFNVDLVMSRSYMEYMDYNIPMLENALLDPLVVNVGSATADISDQTFMFDLDGDGTKEEINMLGRGSGFLALDLNEDGVINDGNELFGTKTGDAFGDLRKYDSDGNGWIDENDEIFSKLKVWCKDANGKDILMDLKEADIGAIFLGEQSTQYTLNGADGGRNGVIRSTGFFLRENGSAGTVQHVDMEVHDDADDEKNNGDMTILYMDMEGKSGINVSDNNRSRRQDKVDTNKAREEKRLKKKQLEEEYEQKLFERRAQIKKLSEEAEERRRDYSETLYERYQWRQFMQAYNIVG